VVTAAVGGPKIVEKGKLSDAVVVDVLIKKYLSHLSLPAGPPKITQIVRQEERNCPPARIARLGWKQRRS